MSDFKATSLPATQTDPPVGLLRGTGFDLGPYARRLPLVERSLVRLLAEQAAERPDHTWLVFDSGPSITFGEAEALVNQVAHAVIGTVGEGAHVGLFLRNQVEFLPAFLGAMAAGGVAVPLNAEGRGPLLAYVIERSDAQVLVVRADLVDRLQDLDSLGPVRTVVVVGDGDVPASIHAVPVVQWEQWVGSRPTTPARAFPRYDDPALIQFTSGTTGRSKGAVYPHHFLYLYPAMVADSLSRRPEDVLTTPLPLYHVAALHLVANTALHAGCTAHLKSKFSASRYWEQVAADGATYSVMLGPMAALVMKTVDGAPPHRMETMFCLPAPPEREEFERRFKVKILWHGYGMTEIYPLPMMPDVIDGAPPGTLGYPVRWMDYGVVDEHDQLVPPGETGELVFRPLIPHAMAREYYKDPEASLVAFRNFMFHTGDVASYDEDGCLHYHGRMQERLRRRGENVSAYELELVALKHPQVLEAAAFGVPAALGEHDIKLDVRCRERVDLAELHEWLQQNLPRYMVPRYLELRESFPKTPSERIEKYKLLEEGVDRPTVYDGERR
jgi:crotonobetaine/carnitine-CoA ligase